MRRRDWFCRELTGTDHILPLLQELRLEWQLNHFPPRLVRSVYVFVNGFITVEDPLSSTVTTQAQ